MNPDQKQLDMLKKDYLEQKYPGNLSEMVGSELCPTGRKNARPRVIAYAILAIAATVLISFGLNLWISNERPRPMAKQTRKENIGKDETTRKTSSKLSTATQTKKRPTAAASFFFRKNMAINMRTQNRTRSLRRPQASADSPTNNPSINSVKRKSSFWRTATDRLAKQPKTNSERTGSSSGTNKQNRNKNRQRHRWFKPSYEFKSITNPFYKYRRT